MAAHVPFPQNPTSFEAHCVVESNFISCSFCIGEDLGSIVKFIICRILQSIGCLEFISRDGKHSIGDPYMEKLSLATTLILMAYTLAGAGILSIILGYFSQRSLGKVCTWKSVEEYDEWLRTSQSQR